MFHTVAFDITMSWGLPNYHPSSLIGQKCSCGDGYGNAPGDCTLVPDRYHPASLSSESWESLRHMDGNLSTSPVSMVMMRYPCAGDGL